MATWALSWANNGIRRFLGEERWDLGAGGIGEGNNAGKYCTLGRGYNGAGMSWNKENNEGVLMAALL